MQFNTSIKLFVSIYFTLLLILYNYEFYLAIILIMKICSSDICNLNEKIVEIENENSQENTQLSNKLENNRENSKDIANKT